MIRRFLPLILALVGYVVWHLWRITPHGWKWVSVGLFVLWMASFFVGHAINDRIPMNAASVLYEVGNTWLIAFLYLLLIFIVADVAALCHILPKAFLKDSVAGLGIWDPKIRVGTRSEYLVLHITN